MANPQVVVDFVAHTDQLNQGFRSASSGASGFGSKLKSVAKAGAFAAGAAGVAGLTAAVKIGIDEFSQAQKVTAQTEAVLKSTGKSAGVTAKQITDMAGALMKKSGVDDEAIQSGENLLLTFTNIRNEAGKGNDIFSQATSTMLDMSTALGQDMKSSAIQLGKALNDPVKGITALQRVGVSFTQGQKDQIKALAESGDRLGAQKIILAELNKEFGGSAEAAGKTLPGQLNILKQSFANLMGDLVGKVIPVIEDLIKLLRDNWPAISAALGSAWSVIGPLLTALGNLAASVATAIRDNWDTIGPVLEATVTNVSNAVKVITAILKLLTAILRGDWAEAWQQAKAVVVAVFNFLVGYVTGQVNVIRAVLTAAWNAIKAVTAAIWGGVQDVIHDVVGSVKSTLSGLASWVSGFASGVLAAAVSRVAAVFDRIANGAEDALHAVRSSMNSIVSTISGIVDRVASAASSIANAIKTPINAVLRAWNSITLTIPKINIPKLKIGKKTFGGGSFGGGSIGFPNVPLLAEGGVVSSPTLAMVGEGQGREIVAPESLLRQIMGEASVQVRVFIGQTELTDLVRTEIVDANTGLARSLLAGGAA